MKYKGMTVNESLYHSGNMEAYDNAIKLKDLKSIISILKSIDLSCESILSIIESLDFNSNL